ncbi:MAG: orotate phosphoribosyltransferase [Ignavibacteriales bacterium]|nr:orotate phosphoribosyltransferase [Ignavibacteriales bacterium]
MSREKIVAEILLKLNAVTLRTNPPFTWASGIKSPIYTDNRLLISFPQEREKIVETFSELIESEIHNSYGFAGTATAGIPWASFLAQKLFKPMLFVRSSAKDHGKENLIEGKIETGKNYIVVEDLISTGGSSIKAINAVRDVGGIVEHCIAIFSYELPKAKMNFENLNCKLHTLTNFTSLIETAIEMKYISANEKEIILKWKENLN